MRKKTNICEPDYKRAGYAKKRKIKNFFILNLGVLLIAVGVYFFKYPNNFALGGVSGISVILGEVIPKVSPALAAFIINISLLIVAYFFLGKEFLGKTAYASVLLSVLLLIFDRYVPIKESITGEKMLELLIAIMLSALGAALLFNFNASSGGTDIIALIMEKYTSADIARALLISDFVVAFFTFFIFDLQSGLYSIFGLSIKGFLVDALIARFNRVKCFTIITSKPDLISEYVRKFLQRSCTRMDAIGTFSGKERSVFICVVDLRQAKILEKKVKELDPSCFVIIQNTSEVAGKGFITGF